MDPRITEVKRSYSIICKPVGARCNLSCRYCYYRCKDINAPLNSAPHISDDILESFIRQNIAINTIHEMEFVWQGGEPMLAGLDFYKNVVQLQQKYNDGKVIHNVLQTNATLLNEEWCTFLRKNDFLLGVSIDGPKEHHDKYRKHKKGASTFDEVMRGITLLKQSGIPFNTLTVLNRHNAEYPLEVYRFLKDIGSTFIQFSPLVERNPSRPERDAGIMLAEPPQVIGFGSPGVFAGDDDFERTVWHSSVLPQQFGSFYKAVLDEWLRHDVGQVFIQLFEATIGNLLGKPAGICSCEPVCGHAAILECDGTVYSCDHFVYPHYRLGNLLDDTLKDMLEKNREFGLQKALGLPEQCIDCSYNLLCHGGCMKHRIETSVHGQHGLNYLCEGYYSFYQYFSNRIKSSLLSFR